MITRNQIEIGSELSPDFLITLWDKSMNEQLSTPSNIKTRLISLTLTDNIGFESDTLSLELDDSDGKLVMPEKGVNIGISLGWKNKPLVSKGIYIVDKITYQGSPDKLSITANSMNFRGEFNSPREESYKNTTLGNLAKTIAVRNELSLSISEKLEQLVMKDIIQSSQSDSELLFQLGRKNNFTVAVKNGVLTLFEGGFGTSVSGKPMGTKTLERHDCSSFIFKVTERKSSPVVIAKWHDYKDAKTYAVRIKAKEETVKTTSAAHPAAKSTGSAQDSSEKITNYLSGDIKNASTLSKLYRDKEEATMVAVSRWFQIQREGVDFSVQLHTGMESLVPGMLLNLKGFKQVIDDRLWNIKSVVHKLSGKGFTSALELDILSSDLEYVAEYGLLSETTQ
ncbi:late control D family protein [Dickeya oryzae]|uniref:late control D family protein n=1 Tax=Dickeya oryzae TaxID=1240404 RepID=UPI0020974B69|nr:late control D family protein [Dickeya oryzae]MCO7254397.1 late control D family protein [Dickeya oryzae]